MKKIFVVLGMAAMMALPMFAVDIEITASDGPVTVSVPDDLVNIVNSNRALIEEKLKENNINKSELENIASKVTDAYKDIGSSLGTTTPYTTARNGLNDFSEVLSNAIPNSQIQQNVWANSWIGYLVQVGNGKFCPRFGLGVNVGAASMDMKPIKSTSSAFKMDLGGLPDLLAMPTVTADLRLGGVKVGDFALPFDFGFTLTTLNSSKLGLDSLLKHVTFDYFAIGFDIRYCVWEPKVLDTKVSVGAGFYYTKGKVDVNSDDASAGLNFKSTNFTLNAQISTKLLFFRPFFGARFMFTNSSVDWYAKGIKWNNILKADNRQIIEAIDNGLLPSNFEGGASGFKFRPVIQGGFAFDFAVIDLTFSASYDIPSNVFGGAFSLRFSL